MRCNIARSIAGGGGNIAVGSYAGNGGEQSFNLGFKPAAVIVSLGGNATEAEYAKYQAVVVTADTPPAISIVTLLEITENGFAVHAGKNGITNPYLAANKTYNYVAIA